MRLLIILLFALLVGCESAPKAVSPVTASSGIGGIEAFGTLASSDDVIEMQAAAGYTSLARLAYNVRFKSQTKQITLNQTREFRDNARALLDDLDNAVGANDLAAINQAKGRIKALNKQLGTY